MKEGQSVKVGTRSGVVPGVIEKVVDGNTADVRIKPGTRESYLHVGCVRVGGSPEYGQFAIDGPPAVEQPRVADDSDGDE